MVFIAEADADRMGIADGDFVRVTLAARLDRARREGLAPRDARLVLHPVPLPRGGREPAHDRRDRPVREDPRVQVLRGPRRADRPRRRRAARLAPGAAGSGLMSEGNGRVPGVEARAGKFPGPSLIPPLTAIQREHGWLPREQLVALARDWRRPLYEIEGIISFYPHFRTSPPERRCEVAVCRDLSCWLSRERAEIPDGADGARGLVRRALRPGAGRDRRRALPGRATAARAGARTTRTAARTSTTACYRAFDGDPVPVLDESRPARAWAAPASRPARSGRWSAARTTRSSTSSATPTRPSPGRSRTARSSPNSRIS